MATKNVTDCLQMKKITKFNSRVQINKGSQLVKKANYHVILLTTFKNKEKIVISEILVYDAPGLVSEMGGIISLFLGFSFFGVFSDIFGLIERKT